MNIKRVASDNALIIADPPLNGFIHQLPGAVAEANEVAKILDNNAYPKNALVGKEASVILENLFSKDYSVIHFAGHGVANPCLPKKSGMVIGRDLFLTVFDIEQMTVIPELVFVNCCYLGKINAGEEKYFNDRFKLAANFGTELIRIGVKAVVAAGWAVDDEAALDFARQFYEAMFAGSNFGESVKRARAYVYEKHKFNNTWGAYQCYGDPFFKLKNANLSKKSRQPSYILPEEAEIDLENMLNQLQMGKGTISANREYLDLISRAVEDSKIRNARITEMEAQIYIEMVMYDEAVLKFQEMLKFEKAQFSYSSIERHFNLLAKWAISYYFQNGNRTPVDPGPEMALEKIETTITNLKWLLKLGVTAERLNLMGSTFKRKAMLLEDRAERNESYKSAAYYYFLASNWIGNDYQAYSFTNAIEMECILVLNGAAQWNDEITIKAKLEIPLSEKQNLGKFWGIKVTANTLSEGSFRMRKSNSSAKNELNNKKTDIQTELEKDSLTYWDMVANINIELCLLLVSMDKKVDDKNWEEIIDNFKKIWEKAGSIGKKVAELEHLQFLIYSISTSGKQYQIDNLKGLNFENENNRESLEKLINLLRTVINSIKLSR